MGKEVNEVMEGYKETEIGALPEDWDVVELGSVVSFTKKPRGLKVNESAIPFIPMDSIPNDGFFIKNYTLKPREEITSNVYCEKGDILLARITPCFENGKQGILRDIPTYFAYATTEVYPLKPNPWKIEPLFLFHCLRQPDIRRQLAGKMEGATGRQRIPKSVLEAHLLPLPPLPEQRKIAYVLSTIQRAIELQDKVIAATREIKKSLMRHLFTYGPVPVDQIDRVPLKETEIGPVPEHWEVVRISEHCEKPQYGYTASATTEPVGPRFLRITEIEDSGVNWTTVPFCYCSEGDVSKYRLNVGDIVVARIGATTGKSHLISECPLSVFASYLIRIQAKPSVDSQYLYYFFNTEEYWNQINANKESNLKKGVSASVLANLLFPLPPYPEQKEIAVALSALDHKIQIEEKRKSNLQSLFQAMLHLLMTGKVSVKDLEVKEDAFRR